MRRYKYAYSEEWKKRSTHERRIRRRRLVDESFEVFKYSSGLFQKTYHAIKQRPENLRALLEQWEKEYFRLGPRFEQALAKARATFSRIDLETPGMAFSQNQVEANLHKAAGILKKIRTNLSALRTALENKAEK